MKKILVLVFAVVSLMANVNAQEVRGVETKLVTYQGKKYEIDKEVTKDLWFGYSFRNMNSIPVSVDIALYAEEDHTNYGQTTTVFNKLQATKTVVLEPGEEYIFKQEADVGMRVFDWDLDKKNEPVATYSSCESYRRNYYVTYKAYKLQ